MNDYKIKHIPAKRIFDLLFSTVALALCLPIFIVIAIAVKINSRGAIFFCQERIGRGGETFKCLKFRTMYTDSEKKLHDLLKTNPAMMLEWQQKRKLTNDPRVTPVGQFLRRTSLDELPQFFNVLKGDLSVVGPRPVVKEEIVQHFGMKAGKILSIRPGITGIWQVSGRSDLPYSRRVKLDEKYVDNRSLALDIKLIFKTIPKMINTKGAY